MFGYVRPPAQDLPEGELNRFRTMYCGLCHTLSRRYGQAARMILNYDFTYLAILLSNGTADAENAGRCWVSPVKKRPYLEPTAAMELAADESVILAYWQLMDGVRDHGKASGWKYRVSSDVLRSAYQRAATFRPEFAEKTRIQLEKLAELEKRKCPSLDEPADTFGVLLAGAAEEASSEEQRRILHQILYHLGRWIYLIDAADDLKDDMKSGGYNPLVLRYDLKEASLNAEQRAAFTRTLDHSIHMITTAYELWDFGCWSAVLEATFYTGLFQVGKAVLDGTFHAASSGKKKDKIIGGTA